MSDDQLDTGWFDDEIATFGDRLAGAREASGLTQNELARRLGVKVKTLRSWEQDLSEPRANRLSMLSGMLGVSLKWILTGEGEGLDEPEALSGLDKDLAGVFKEMRQIKVQMVKSSDQLGRLEKRIRQLMKDVG